MSLKIVLQDLKSFYDSRYPKFYDSALTLTEDPKSLTTIIAAVVCTTLSLLITYRILFHPLSGIPGPFLARISGEWRNHRYRRGTWHQDILEIHNKYGRVVRIAPNELSIVDEYAMKHLYGHSHNAAKTNWYNIWDPPGGTPMFSETDKKIHSFLRKRVSGAYSMSAILKYEPYIQTCLDLLLYRLKELANTNKVVDMSSWTNALAFDVVGELAYGEELGHLRTGKDVGGLRRTIFNTFYFLSTTGHYRIVAKIISSKFMAAVGSNPYGDFFKWSVRKVQHRLDHLEETNREDMLSHFCRMKDADGKPTKADEVLIEAMNLVGAGADTTSIGMKTCLYYLWKSPKDYKLVQKEIDDFYRENNLSDPITYLQTQKLPILQAVVKEATRLLPSIVFQLLRHAPENFVVRDYHIPAGTPVGISPISQNRDREIWGEDADEFRPSRWLENEAQSKYFDSSTMTFGGNGPRVCVGKNIALVEIHKFLAQFMYHFDFEVINPEKPWRITTYWFAMQHDFNMKVTARKGRILRVPEGVEAL